MLTFLRALIVQKFKKNIYASEGKRISQSHLVRDFCLYRHMANRYIYRQKIRLLSVVRNCLEPHSLIYGLFDKRSQGRKGVFWVLIRSHFVFEQS